MRGLIIALILSGGCAHSQRLYNEPKDRQAAAALAQSQELLSGQIWDKALGNLEELFKLRQQAVFDSTQGVLKSEWASWETWADVQATFDRLPAPPPAAEEAAVTRELIDLKASRDGAETELDKLRAKLLQNKTAEQVRMVGLWMERIGAAKPLFDRVLQFEEKPAELKANLAAAVAAKTALDRLSTLYKGFQSEIPEETASSIFLEGKIRLLELEQAHLVRLASIDQRLQDESVRVRSLRRRSQVQLSAVRAKYPDTKIAESFTNAQTANPDLIEDMVGALFQVAAYSARADLPARLAGHRESLELRAQAIRRDAANAAVYERTIANGIQRLATYYKGGIRPENLAAFIRALATAGIVPAILTR